MRFVLNTVASLLVCLTMTSVAVAAVENPANFGPYCRAASAGDLITCTTCLRLLCREWAAAQVPWAVPPETEPLFNTLYWQCRNDDDACFDDFWTRTGIGSTVVAGGLIYEYGGAIWARAVGALAPVAGPTIGVGTVAGGIVAALIGVPMFIGNASGQEFIDWVETYQPCPNGYWNAQGVYVCPGNGVSTTGGGGPNDCPPGTSQQWTSLGFFCQPIVVTYPACRTCSEMNAQVYGGRAIVVSDPSNFTPPANACQTYLGDFMAPCGNGSVGPVCSILNTSRQGGC